METNVNDKLHVIMRGFPASFSSSTERQRFCWWKWSTHQFLWLSAGPGRPPGSRGSWPSGVVFWTPAGHLHGYNQRRSGASRPSGWRERSRQLHMKAPELLAITPTHNPETSTLNLCHGSLDWPKGLTRRGFWRWHQKTQIVLLWVWLTGC